MVSYLLYDIGTLIVAIAIPVIGGVIGSAFGGGDSEWFRKLVKPAWTPPPWAFPIVWTTLYVLMGIASWLIFTHGGLLHQAFPLAVYLVQLLINFGWSPIFFGLHRPDISFGWIIMLWVAVAINIYFFTVVPAAAYLLIPYILWVTVAAVLNWFIWKNNPLQPPPPSEITAPLHGGPGGPGTPSA